ncbi:GGDEF domain-containing protein [Ralstonia solanacearum]
MIDLDGFKAINDCYGHAAGDDVLRGTAERVVQNTRTQDHAARLGGDEFAVILPNCDLQTAVTFADRIRAALARQPVLAAGARAQIALSQGWWNCRPTMPMPRPSWRAPMLPATARKARAATPSPRAERMGRDTDARRAPMKKPPDNVPGGLKNTL